MVRIAAAGRQTLLGSEDPYAKKDEEFPRLLARFDYDFWMDSTEITQGEFQRLMGRNPAEERLGLGPDHPVYNVTFFDAVLYCNARSRAENRDTVYAYARKLEDAGGRVYALEGLVIQFDRAGYRLPTEAEWEFAARAGVESTFPWGEDPDGTLAGSLAWFGGYAGGKTHPVGGLAANAFGLKDMLGNVMEWTNDWKGPYSAVTARNFLGTLQPGSVAERVVKGGAYSYDIRFLRFAGRSANYPTLSHASADYIGFRCVLGALRGGEYLSGGGAHPSMPPVALDRDAAKAIFGHAQAKLAFVNAEPSRRVLAYADFSENPVLLREFPDDTAVFHPAISPDGEWVAYGDLPEGQNREGRITLRRLRPGSDILRLPAPGAIPRWHVRPGTQDTFLVFASRPRDNLDPAWKEDATYRMRISGGRPVGDPVRLAAGGYHDGLSGDGKYLATAFRRLRLLNRQSGLERILFTGPDNGKPAGDTSQVCNLSLSPDWSRNPHMLLVDFGNAAAGGVVGRPYGLHEILFRLDTLGRVLRWYGAPPGFSAWQDAEWSNHSGFAVAAGESQSRDYPAVLALDLETAASAVLAKGTTLRDPALWIRPGARAAAPGSDPDSLGRYNDPAIGIHQQDLAMRMKLLWLRRKTAKVVCLGSSHVLSGIWPQSFRHYQALNLGYTAGGHWGSRELLRYVLPHFSRLRAVVLEVNIGWLNSEDKGFVYFDRIGTGPGNTLGHRYDRAHAYWTGGVPPLLDTLMRTYSDPAIPLDSLGGYFWPQNQGWGSVPPLVAKTDAWTMGDNRVVAELASLGEVARILQERGVLLVLTVFPQSPAYRNTPYFGKYGPPWETAREALSKVDSICARFSLCRFYDAHRNGAHDYVDSMALNEDHMSTAGARQLSARLDSLIWNALGGP